MISPLTLKQITRIGKAYGLYKEDFAYMFNVSTSTARAWEQGKRLPSDPFTIIFKHMLKLYNNEFARKKALKIVGAAKGYCKQWGEDPLQYLMENLFKIEEE